MFTYPTILDTFYVHPDFARNQYTAGTFRFVPASVPEPSALALLMETVLFGGGLLLCRRRKGHR